MKNVFILYHLKILKDSHLNLRNKILIHEMERNLGMPIGMVQTNTWPHACMPDMPRASKHNLTM